MGPVELFLSVVAFQDQGPDADWPYDHLYRVALAPSDVYDMLPSQPELPTSFVKAPCMTWKTRRFTARNPNLKSAVGFLGYALSQCIMHAELMDLLDRLGNGGAGDGAISRTKIFG
jgi:hypothetical protein